MLYCLNNENCYLNNTIKKALKNPSSITFVFFSFLPPNQVPIKKNKVYLQISLERNASNFSYISILSVNF